jgi:Holliday junction DNA helicase RuvA
MISRIRGLLRAAGRDACEVDVGGVCYEVLLPPAVAERLTDRAIGSEVELFTFHYLQTDPQKSLPVLLGFESRQQRDFFEMLTTVPKFGPRAALKAMALPVATLAQAIQAQDLRVLRSLPGVGPQKARDLIAALEGKVIGFTQLEAGAEPVPLQPTTEAESDALDVLEQLGMPRADAMRRVAAVRREHPDLERVDDLVRLVFRQG